MAYNFTVTKEIIDRYGDVVMIDGIDIENYKSNPVVLYEHSAKMPIGKCNDISKSGDELIASVEIDIEIEDCAEIAQKIDKGILSAVSAGYLVRNSDVEYITNEAGEFQYRKIKAAELVEISIVSIPANPKAVIQKSANSDSFMIYKSFNNSKTDLEMDKDENAVIEQQPKTAELLKQFNEIKDLAALNEGLVLKLTSEKSELQKRLANAETLAAESELKLANVLTEKAAEIAELNAQVQAEKFAKEAIQKTIESERDKITLLAELFSIPTKSGVPLSASDALSMLKAYQTAFKTVNEGGILKAYSVLNGTCMDSASLHIKTFAMHNFDTFFTASKGLSQTTQNSEPAQVQKSEQEIYSEIIAETEFPIGSKPFFQTAIAKGISSEFLAEKLGKKTVENYLR